jgi:peptide deformylase
MTAKEKITTACDALDALEIIRYPDPRLKELCSPIETVDDDVRRLIDRMTDLMFDSKGVGLAAPQVGVSVRLFLASPSFRDDDLHVYINPAIVDSDGQATDEEGCLSFPQIFTKVKRARRVTIEALDRDGQRFTQDLEDLHARIAQHEGDHLDGVLLVDRMGSVAKMGHRKALAALEELYAAGS